MFKLFYWIEEIITKTWALVSSKTEVRIKRYDQKKFDYETNFEIWKLKKNDVTGSLDRWKQDETIDAGFI